MGTPHGGGSGAEQALIITNILKAARFNANRDMIRDLRAESMELFRATDEFRKLVNRRKMKVYTIYEGKKMILWMPWPKWKLVSSQ